MTTSGQRELLKPPFTAFNFAVEISTDGEGPLCSAAFAECDGLEMTLEPKTIQEGGRNSGPIHLVGPVGYGQLTLKRGMTANLDLWKWFEKVGGGKAPGARATAEVRLLSASGDETDARFVLEGCLPVKLKAPSLNAAQGAVAVEELQVAYESLRLDTELGSSSTTG